VEKNDEDDQRKGKDENEEEMETGSKGDRAAEERGKDFNKIDELINEGTLISAAAAVEIDVRSRHEGFF